MHQKYQYQNQEFGFIILRLSRNNFHSEKIAQHIER